MVRVSCRVGCSPPARSQGSLRRPRSRSRGRRRSRRPCSLTHRRPLVGAIVIRRNPPSRRLRSRRPRLATTPPEIKPRPAHPSRAPSGQVPKDLVAACGLTKIAPPRRGELTYFPDLEEASKRTGIGMPVSPANSDKPQPTTPAASQTEVSDRHRRWLNSPVPPAAPVEVKTQSPTKPETSTPPTTEPTTPAGIPMDPPKAAEVPAEPSAPAETPSQPPTALELPAEPTAPAKTPSQPPTALNYRPSQPLLRKRQANPQLPSSRHPSPPAPAETPSQPACPSTFWLIRLHCPRCRASPRRRPKRPRRPRFERAGNVRRVPKPATSVARGPEPDAAACRDAGAASAPG